MNDRWQIVQLVLEGGATFALLMLPGVAYAREHLTVVREYARARYWPLLKQGFFLCFLLSALLLAWLLEEGGVVVELSSAFVGLLIGLSVGLLSAIHELWLRRSLMSGLILIFGDCILEAFGRSYLGGLVGALLVGVAIAVGVGILSVIAGVVAWRFGDQLRIWSLRTPALASLLLVAGGPALWLVIASGVIFGFSCAGRYRLSREIPSRTAFLVALAVLAYAHAIYSFYFSFMSNYGIFSHSVVSVSPYALVSIATGAALHRIGGVSWPFPSSPPNQPLQRTADAAGEGHPRWADETLMERMHRFVTFIGGAAPGPRLGPMSDPHCVIHGVALCRRTGCRFPSSSWPAAVILSCEDHRLVRRFP